MGNLITIDEFDNFSAIRDIKPDNISENIISAVRVLNERDELEPFIRSVIYDTNETPHGPAEIADIITHKVKVNKESGLAAFILKGKSFLNVKSQDVAHQIYRLEKIDGLKYAIFAATGTILDAAKEHFCSTSERLGLKYAIFDANDLARLFIAYGFFCPRDGQKISAGRCKCGYSPTKRILNVFQSESLKALNEAHIFNQKAGLIVLPPGSGKTRIAAEDAKTFGATNILYVAHTHEILDVAISEFEAVFGNQFVTKHDTVFSLNKPNRINIATIQFIHKNIETIIPNTFDYIVIDEFHHAAAEFLSQSY